VTQRAARPPESVRGALRLTHAQARAGAEIDHLQHDQVCHTDPATPTKGSNMLLRASLATLALTAAGIAVAGPAEAAIPDAGSCLIAAHRGNSNVAQTVATENTMQAARRAVAAGADILETDAGATSDDTAMLMHDATVDRTTDGTGTLRSKTGSQVKALHTLDGVLGGVPYLSEWTSYVLSSGVEGLLELKSPGGTAWWNRVVAQVGPHQDRFIIQSLSAATLDKAHQLLPNVRLALVVFKATPVSTVAPYGGVVLDQSLLTPDYEAQLSAQGIAAHPYVENTQTAWQRDLGHVSSIITNKPAELAAFRSTDPSC
jgi:glycerophosphoryl diester phosphodiesterase